MPLSEMCPTTKRKLDSAQDKNTSCSNDLSFVQGSDIVELVLENGQIMMQGQSNRARKNPTHPASISLPSHGAKFRAKDTGNGSNSKLGKFRTVDSVLNEYPFSVPIGEMGLDQDDDTVPWLGYPIDGSFQHEYGSDILPELSGVTVNELSTHNSFPFVGKAGTSNQSYNDSHSNSLHNRVHLDQANASKISSAIDNGATGPCTESGRLYPFSSPLCQTSIHSSTSRVLGNTDNSTFSATNLSTCKESSGIPANGFCEMKLQNSSHPPTSRNDSNLMNFSHFARPVALYRAKSQNRIAEGSPGLPSMGKIGCTDKGSVMNYSAPTDSTLVNSTTGLTKEISLHCQPIASQSKAASKPMEPEPPGESPAAKSSEAICKETALANHKTSDEMPGESASIRLQDGKKATEPVVAASSVCSGNSLERASNDLKLNPKRKWHDNDESGCPSADIEAESAGVKKAASNRSSTGSKRTRAAEVHNLSERRRRDRINEKMRALQELIPNCSKVDKASMLDEAIEYLKTLQLQVQIMSMGAGLYMSPVMLPTGVQHMHPSHMAHFSPMGVGLGMGFRMGMLDMNGVSSGCPMLQMPSMQGTHFPSSHMLGPGHLHRLPRSNLQTYGHPNQGLAMPMSQASTIPFPGGLLERSSMGLDATAAAGHMGNSGSTSASASKSVNSQVMQSPDANNSGNHTCTQCQATSMPLGQTAMVQNCQALDGNLSGSFQSANANDKVAK